MALQIGDKAPDFKVQDDTDSTVRLSDFKGKKVLLYFYPKDSTPGCTKESCDLRDKFPVFTDQSVVILGVSRDSIASHQKFKQKYHLPYQLLADTDSAICEAYGVLVDKKLFSKKYKGIERSTFLIDEQGRIQQIWRKVKVLGHCKEILQAVKG